MKIRDNFILLIILSLFLQISIAQENKVYDPFSNEEFSYKTLYKEVKDLELNKDNDIDIDYFAMRNTNGRNYDKINAYISQLALEEWKSKEKKFELNNDVNTQLNKYVTFLNSSNKYYNKVSKNKSFDLKSLEIEFVSVCDGKLTFKQSYNYDIATRDIYDNETTLEHYFVADLFTQNVNRLTHQFNEKEIAIIDKTLAPYLTEYSNRLVENNSSSNRYYFDYDDEIVEGVVGADEVVFEEPEVLNEEGSNGSYNKNSNRKKDENDKVFSPPVISDIESKYVINEESNEPVKQKNKIRKIDFNDAHYFWYAWGLVVKFPEFAKSTYLNNGKSFSLFVPFNDAKSILNLIPSYASFSKLIQPAHQFNNFNYFEITSSYSQYRQTPTVTALFTLNNAPEKPKKLIVGSYQLFENDKKNFRGNFIYEFDLNAKNFQQAAANKSYSYHEEKVGERLKNRANTKDKNKDILKFDERENLILRKTFQSSNDFNYQYFYNESMCYSFKHSKDKFEPMEKLSLKNNEICIKDVCLSLNKNFKVDAIKMLKYQYNDAQIGFDEKDRLIEAHSENDRYNYYYEYDAQDRLIKYTYYEYQKLEREVIFLYKGNKKLPYLQKTRSLTNKIVEEESYEWEY